ncbi:methyl-accepting chemotaxis protein [Sporosalibacterium faouarense]|uniref:methyl-accepting chemotaxis protein n=1 Tax=Sporosalibacterium faouarense TaxID=516123 RepID=UPI00192C6C15|nr:methyl-accepting chemotaxis protein [Sporosalibacterium faouarense]
MRKRFRKTIYNKLLILCLLLLILPSLAIGLQSYRTAKSELDNKGKVILSNSVEQVIQLIEEKQREIERGNIDLSQAQEEVKTYLLGEKNEDGTRTIDNEVDLGDNGYFYVLDDEGNTIAHPSLEGKSMWEMQDKSNEGYYFAQDAIKKAMNGGGFVDYKWELPNSSKVASKIIYGKQDNNWGWIVTAGTYTQDFNKGSNKVVYIMLITLGIAFLIGIIFIILFARHISKPIRKISESLEEVANGDLTIEEIKVKNRDETGGLAESFNKMLNNLKNIIKSINNSSNTVSSASDSLSEISKETSTAIEEVAYTISEIANSSSEQAKDVEDGSVQIVELGKEIENVAKLSLDMDDISNKTNNLAGEGIEVVNTLINKTKESENASKNINEVIVEVNNSTGQIEVITETIRNIAEQTNLLALNASIEAARAGDAGKGFAVVADEIRTLAEQSSEAIQGINGILEEIKNKSEMAVKSMDDAKGIVLEQNVAVSDTENIFNQISESILRLTNIVSNVSDHSSSMNNKKEKLITMIESLSAISEETAASTQEISASTQQQSASIQQVANYADKLDNLSDQLMEIINKFKIE